MKLVSVDLETTGLDPFRHEAWEIAIVPIEKNPTTILLHLPVSLTASESKALEIGGYHERSQLPPPGRAYRWYNAGRGASLDATTPELIGVDHAATCIARELADASLVGMSVHFDAAFLLEFLRRNGICQTAPWHHRHLDLGSYAAGAVGSRQALSSMSLADRVPNPDAHSALDDAEWNVEVYEAIRDGRFS